MAEIVYDRRGDAWEIVSAPFVQSVESGERYTRRWVEERFGPLVTSAPARYWWSPNNVQHVIHNGKCVTCGRWHELYVTPGHPVRSGAGYDCACGECLAVRNGAEPASIAVWRMT